MEKVKFKKLKPDSNGNTCSIEHKNAKAVCWCEGYPYLIYPKGVFSRKYTAAQLTQGVRIYARSEKELKEKIQALSNFLDQL